MIDTHTHLYLADSFPDGGLSAVDNAVAAGVEMMVLPAIDRESVEPMLALHRHRPQHTAPALGLHPTEVEADWREELQDILNRFDEGKIVAIGETGIDLYWEKKHLTRQMDAFGEQIQTALDRNLPVIVHSRDATAETAEVIKNFGYNLPGIVFHSFTSGIREAEMLLEVAPEAFFGINGVVTFKNAKPLQEAVKRLDMARIVTETDSPFLAPVPHRGQTNCSAYIPHVITAISGLKEMPEEAVKIATTANARRLFPLL